VLYGILKPLCVMLFGVLFGVRCYGAGRTPASGGFILASNHQSFLDPVLLGLGLRRKIGFVARSTLFTNPLFGWFIRQLGAVPIERGKGDLGALRTMKKALREGRILVLFPEGTRTRDGEVGPCKAGAAITARAAKVPVVHAAIDGAFRAWPRTQALFRPHRPVRVVYGEPVRFEGRRDHEELAGEIRGRLVALLHEARSRG
jgi:1-acyl-sn-glycerol-3-phosphate acyltransferase